MATYHITDSIVQAALETAIASRATTLATTDSTRFSTELTAYNNAVTAITTEAEAAFPPVDDELKPEQIVKRGNWISTAKAMLVYPHPARTQQHYIDRLRMGTQNQ
jgi:hypothetical protein